MDVEKRKKKKFRKKHIRLKDVGAVRVVLYGVDIIEPARILQRYVWDPHLFPKKRCGFGGGGGGSISWSSNSTVRHRESLQTAKSLSKR